MQKILLYTVVLFSFAACSLDKLEPAQTDAFMKFFGDVGNTDGVDLLKLDDGYLLLGNNTNSGLETAILIKTDVNGNQIWSTFFENITGSALAKDDNSYFIVGDSINTGNLLAVNKMIIIKTDLDGGNHQFRSLGVTNVPYHGTGITVSSTGEVVVCGFINGLLSGTDTTFLYGYSNLLVPTWAEVRKWKTDAESRVSSKTLIQNDDGNFVFTMMYGDNNSIESVISEGDTPEFEARDLLKDFNSTADLGDFYESGDDNNGILVQTVDNGNKNIAMVTYNPTSVSPPIIIGDITKDSEAASVIKASDGDFVILGSADNPSDSRPDSDFYLTKVGFDGTVSAVSGFEEFIGGTGEESGSALVQADDRGFVFLGTMENTNKVKIMVLVKVNIRGELIN
jgi:hypothetical protein